MSKIHQGWRDQHWRPGHDPNRIMIDAQHEALMQARPEAMVMDGF